MGLAVGDDAGDGGEAAVPGLVDSGDAAGGVLGAHQGSPQVLCGGVGGQAGAVRMGLARAISRFNPELRPALRKNGFLTRDSRMKERKKYGQKGARKRFQFSKR